MACLFYSKSINYVGKITFFAANARVLVCAIKHGMINAIVALKVLQFSRLT